MGNKIQALKVVNFCGLTMASTFVYVEGTNKLFLRRKSVFVSHALSKYHPSSVSQSVEFCFIVCIWLIQTSSDLVNVTLCGWKIVHLQCTNMADNFDYCKPSSPINTHLQQLRFQNIMNIIKYGSLNYF